MWKFWYFLSTFAESGLSVFGIRGTYEQPAYQVVQHLPHGIEIRDYEARVAAETTMTPGHESDAFNKLFRYITGNNASRDLIPMTAPVAETPEMIAMTVPVATAADTNTMRFFLPHSVVSKGVPHPLDQAVHIVPVPAATLGVIRFTGIASARARATETAILRDALAKAGKAATGAPIALSYDPPFAIPFLRRNEIAIPCS